MIRSKSVNDFLDFESREDFAVSKSRTSLSVPNAHRDQDFRRNSNISCETSSSYYSESNEHLITGNRCDSLTLPEILHVAVLGDRGVGKHTLLHHFIDTEDIWSDLKGDFFFFSFKYHHCDLHAHMLYSNIVCLIDIQFEINLGLSFSS